MACGANNIKMEPMDVYIGSDQKQEQDITFVGDTAALPLDEKYFFFYDPAGAKHFAWIDAGGVAPVIAGYTAHAITITALDSAATIAGLAATVLGAVTGFDATVAGNVVTLKCTANGYATLAHDAQADADKTGFGFALKLVGDAFEKIGYIDGDIEVSGLSRSPVDITTHQTGSSVIGQIFSGSGNPELSFSLKEVTTEKYEKVLRYSSGSYLPVGGSNKLIGGGSLGVFQSPQYAKVVLHPVRNDIAIKTSDYCFWSCTIDLDSVSFSSENILTLPVKFKAFEDCTKPKAISVWCYGDWSQSLV